MSKKNKFYKFIKKAIILLAQMLEHNKCITTQFNRLRPLKKDSGYINI